LQTLPLRRHGGEEKHPNGIDVHLADGFICHLGTDTIAAISKNGSKVMNLLSVPNFSQNDSLWSLLCTDQMMMNGDTTVSQAETFTSIFKDGKIGFPHNP
jgi:hypothetical protein